MEPVSIPRLAVADLVIDTQNFQNEMHRVFGNEPN
jgi:hypothetical protein